MAQLTLYLPDDLAGQLKRQAQRAKKPLSTYVLELIEAQTRPAAWPDEFVRVVTTGSGDIAVPDDPPAEDGVPSFT